MDDITLMRLALAEAEKAAVLGEVPVGAVVAKDGEPVAGCKGGLLRQRNGSVCAAFQSPPPGGGRAAGGRMRRAAGGVF